MQSRPASLPSHSAARPCALPAAEVPPDRHPHCFVAVVNADCLLVAQRLACLGSTPLVLNMANETVPGGGYKTGAAAQEENLHRRSNLFQHLENPDAMPRAHDVMYPIPEFGGACSGTIAMAATPADFCSASPPSPQRYTRLALP